MVETVKSGDFNDWLARLRDRIGRAKILARIARLEAGNAGDVKPVGEGVSELRVDHGPGYRVYFARRGEIVVMLLAGGDKSTQAADIAKAKALAQQWRETWTR